MENPEEIEQKTPSPSTINVFESQRLGASPRPQLLCLDRINLQLFFFVC